MLHVFQNIQELLKQINKRIKLYQKYAKSQQILATIIIIIITTLAPTIPTSTPTLLPTIPTDTPTLSPTIPTNTPQIIQQIVYKCIIIVIL